MMFNMMYNSPAQYYNNNLNFTSNIIDVSVPGY